jgi:DnaJ domain/CSL zinc finger
MSLYGVLGAASTATPDELKEAYRKSLLASHPDKQAAAQGASAVFHEVQLAWQVLGDPQRRAVYDAQERCKVLDLAVVDDEISILEMEVNTSLDDTLLSYQCRCGDLYTVALDDLLKGGSQVLVECRQDPVLSLLLVVCVHPLLDIPRQMMIENRC